MKDWTTRKVVKIISFVLILALCFTALNRIFASIVRADDTGVHPEIVLVDLSANQYFVNQHLETAQHYASVLVHFESEDAIMAGHHLMWFEYSGGITSYEDFGDFYPYDNYDFYGMVEYEPHSELKTPYGHYTYAYIDGPAHKTPGYRARYELFAKRVQLSEFRAALDYLSNTDGLLFYVGVETSPYLQESSITVWPSSPNQEERVSFGVELDGNLIEEYHRSYEVYSNVSTDRQTADFFRSQPVYYIATGDDHSEPSYGMDHSVYLGPGNPNRTIFIAFTAETVSAQNSVYTTVRNAYVLDFCIIAASVLLSLGFLVVLLVGAGRKGRQATDDTGLANDIHFTMFDKPYLDISLFLVIVWSVLIAGISFFVTTLLQYRSVFSLNILFAAVTLLAVPPLVMWLMSLTKRVKAGRFWKHMLIYALPTRSWQFCVLKARELWAGTRLTSRVALISTMSFFMMLFVGFVSFVFRSTGPILAFFISLVFTAVVTYFLLRYAKRIHKLDQDARSASLGESNTPLDVGGGELGSIADSINNISAGINTAVEQRLKSERLKTELITNVSHDIRTPLTSIITYTDLLDKEGLDCKEAPEYLDILKQKSLRLKTLTDELFEAAKAASGNIDVNLTELNIVSLINQVLGELSSAIESSGLDLRINLPEKLHAKADGRLMQRVMENLMSNVFNYSMPGSRVYLDAMPDEDFCIRIDLKNISAVELNFDPSELTERFKRGDDSRADGGSGLGLSIVQSFVTAQGGRFEISIDGDLFKATVFLPM